MEEDACIYNQIPFAVHGKNIRKHCECDVNDFNTTNCYACVGIRKIVYTMIWRGC